MSEQEGSEIEEFLRGWPQGHVGRGILDTRLDFGKFFFVDADQFGKVWAAHGVSLFFFNPFFQERAVYGVFSVGGGLPGFLGSGFRKPLKRDMNCAARSSSF
jgi:hypothetical protein